MEYEKKHKNWHSYNVINKFKDNLSLNLDINIG